MPDRFTNPRPAYYTTSGGLLGPVVNGKLYFYQSGTSGDTGQKDTFSDANLSIPNPNPLLLEADGSVPNCFGSGSYRVVCTHEVIQGGTPTEVQLWERDPVSVEDGNLQFGSTWNAEITYSRNDIVRGDNGAYYMSINDENIANPPESSIGEWVRIFFVQDYDENQTYDMDQPISFGGDLYVSLINGNIGNQPDTSPVEWKTFVLPADPSFNSVMVAAGGIQSMGDIDLQAEPTEAIGCNILADGGGIRIAVIDTGDFSITQRDSVGAGDGAFIEGTRDGPVTIYYNGGRAARSAADGWEIVSPTTVSARLRYQGLGNSGTLSLVRNDGADTWDIRAGIAAETADLQLLVNDSLRGQWNFATGAYTSVSLRDVKDDITPIQNATDIVMQLIPSTYSMGGFDHAGYIADEVEGILDRATVKRGIDGELQGVDHQVINTYLMRAFQEQKERIDLLEQRIFDLENG